MPPFQSEINQWVSEYKSGLSYSQIAKKHGVSPFKAQHWIRQSLRSRPRGKQPKKVKNLTTGEVFDSVQQAAKKYFISKGCIARAIRNKTLSADCRWIYLD